ncbi:MAG: Ig-like domain-containing protein, partial [Candidatus Krumholzibacteriaceae bacterium]
VVANGVDTTVVTVTVRDAQGNPIAGSSVTIGATGTLNTIRQPLGVTDANGHAVGSVKSTKAELKTISATVGGVAITNTRNVTFTVGAFSPVQSDVSISPSTVVANGVDTTVVTVTVRDAQGNLIAGSSVTIGATGTSNTIRQPLGATDANGHAVGSVKSTKAELKTISATVGAVAIATTRSASFGAGPFNAGASDIQVDKTTAVADGVDAITVTVYALDAQSNGIAGKTVTIAATGSGNVLSQPVVTTDSNGRAIGSLRSTVAEGKTISAKADGADIAKTVPVTFGSGGLNHFLVTHGGTATAGQASFVTIDARDSQNNKITNFAGIAKVYTSSTIPGDYITWGLGNAAGSILSEVGDTVRYQFVPADLGDAELSITDTKVESITIYASSGAVTSSSAAPLVVNNAPPDRMILVSGNNQRAVVDQEVASPLVVVVQDAFGNPVPGVTVSWAITKGGGYFDASRSIAGQQTTSVTLADGTAAGELWRLGTVSGLNSDGITASMPSGSTRSVAFTATTDFGPVSSIVLTPASKSVTVNSATIVTATLRDAFANLVANEYVTIFIKDTPDGHLSRASGSSTDSLSASMRRGESDSTGTVRVTYNAPAAAGLQDVIDAYSNTIPVENVADVTYTSVASGATDLRATVLTGQTSQAGATFSFMVEAVDGNGNRDLTNASRIVLNPQTGSGFTFSLTNFGAGVTEANLASGVITLYGRGTKTGGWRTDVNDKASVLLAGHFDITVIPDTVSSYLVVAPSNATAGTDFSVLAQAKDRFGNNSTSANYQINFRAVQAADSTKAASGTLSVPNGSLVNGLFTGSNFHYTVAEQMRVAVTSAANAVKGYSGIVAVGHATAYRLVKIAGDSTGVSVGDSLRLRAQVVDIYGNAVNGQTVFFTVQQGSGHLAAPQAVTDASGGVSLWFRTGTVRGTNVARASILDGAPPELETQSFTVTTVPKSTIASVTLAIPGGTSYHAGDVFAGNVAAYDQYNNLIDTDSSSRLRCVARHSTMSFVPGVMTLSSGTASFTASDTLAGVNRIRVLSLAGDSLSDWSGPLTIQPASAYRIVKVRGDTLGVQVGAKTGLKARVSDRYGNAVPAETVTFVITSNLGGSPSLWDATGVPNDGIVLSDAMGAAVCSLTTDSHAGTNTVSASILDASPPALERVQFSVGTTAGTIARFDVIPDGYSKKAAQNFSLQLTAYDLSNNVATADDTSRVLLGGGSAVFSINPVTLSHGQATVTVHDNKAESLILSAQTLGGGALSHSAAITVSPEVPAGAIAFASIIPDSITANGTSLSAITSQPVKDAYGNVVAPLTLIRVTPSLGTVASDDQDPSTPLTYERQTGATGAVSVFIRSSSSPGTSTVAFQSVTGSASGNATLHFMPPPACAYAGYLTPRYLVPTHPATFRCSVTNGSPTGLNLTTASSISFADSSSHVYQAYLAAPAYVKGSSTDTLDFATATVPAGMLGASYTPQVKLVGTDRYVQPYQVEFNAGSNSVSVSDIEIASVTSLKSIVSRGDTFEVDVRVKNGGGAVVSVTDILPKYRHGYFGLVGGWNPLLPDGLPAGVEKVYRGNMRVLPNSPTGADTINASVTAQVDGSQVQDTSAYPNVAPILIQSAASVVYVSSTLNPSTVSKGQSYPFSLSLRNDGQASVLLDGAKTKLTFTDGSHPVQVALGSTGALPGNKVTGITFPAATIPLAIATGNYLVTVILGGTENGGAFADTLILGDRVDVVNPAHLVYHVNTVHPTIVSKRSAVAFNVGVDNTGGAHVECNPDSTWITFKNGSVVYLARLDGTHGTSIGPGANTLYFASVTVPDAMPTGLYSATVRVMGTENGLPFSTSFVLSDQISVQNPSQLAIASTTVSQSAITADQAPAWYDSIRVDNNGGATVRLDSLSVRLYAGSTEVTNQCVLTPQNFNPHVDMLSGGTGKTIDVQFNDNVANQMTAGTIVIESTVWGKDMNSGATLVATTELGGKGSYLVQTPANLGVVAIVASVDTVTALQTRNWAVDVVLRNTGQSDIRLDPGSSQSFLTFSTSSDFTVLYPTALRGGGLVLEGGSTDTLRYVIDRTGSVSGLCRIESTTRGTEINSGRALMVASGSLGLHDDVLVQTAANLEIVRLTALQNPVTIAQQRDWTVEMDVRNTGGSNATLLLGRTDSTWVAIPGGTGFVIANPATLAGDGVTLRGGSSGALDFTVQTTGSIAAGMHVLTGAILASEDNSGRKLSAARSASASTDSVAFDLLPDPRYVAGSLTPQRVSSGASISFEAKLSSDALLRSELVLDPAKVRLAFGDAHGDTFRTTLSPLSDHVLSRGGQIKLIFATAPLDTAIAHITLPVALHLEGTENGNPFSANIPRLSDSVTVEKAPQLSIDRIVVPQSVTRSQSAPWPVRMILKNNGEASVVISTAAAKTFISFNIVGLGDRTSEYTITYPTHLAGSGSDTLAGGARDSLLFVVTTTGSTTGLALVNGKVTGVDVNSGLTVVDDTYDGGFSHMAIQMPGAPSVAQELPSRTTVTSGQTTSWQIDVEVCNGGEAALTLVMDSTYVFYGGRLLLSHVSPAGFVGGGSLLEGGGSCKHLLFGISPTPVIPAGADIALHAHVGLTENNNGQYRYYDTKLSGSGFGTIRVQAPARLRIVQVTNKAPRSPYVNTGQGFPVLFEVRNEGEARADSIRIALEKSGSSTIADTIALVGVLNGASSAADTFRVTAGGSSGLETFKAYIRGALDDNSRQGNLDSVRTAIDDTAHAAIQGLAALAVTAVTPSQPEVNANQSVDWTVRVPIKNNGEAPLSLGAVAASDISFSRGAVKLTDYSVIAPDTLASGAHILTVAGGGSDELIYRVVSTGSDTGMVAIGALVPWHDMNDPGRAPQTASASGSVHVKPPSGLRIISVTSDAPNNALYPNTSIVDVGQVFDITVRVENTGGDDLDGVTVHLSSNGGSHASIVSDSLEIPSKTVKDFVFSVTAAPAPGTEILSSSITHAVSKNTGQPVIPAQAVESVENLRVELPALLSCGASVTAPAGAIDDTLSTGQSFVVTALVTNEGQAVVDTLGEVTLAFPASMHLAGVQPSVKRFTAGRAVSWTVVAPAAPSQDTVKARISRIPVDVNRAAPAAVHTGEAHLALRTEIAAGLSACAVSIINPPGAVDGTLSTEQTFLVHSVFTPSANADSVWVELMVPGSFSVTGDRTRYIGRGSGAPHTIDWAVEAPSNSVVSDTLVTLAGGKDMNSLLSIQTCRAVFPVHVQSKPVLALSAAISGPPEALDGVVSTNIPFTVTASTVKTGAASVDTTGARIALVLPPGQGYALDGAGEHYLKPFFPGQQVVWKIRAPGSPTSPSNIEVKFVEPYATDVNTNAACTITAGDVFIPVQTEAGSVLMSNISRQDSIPPYVVQQGARGVPIMRMVFRNNSGDTIGLDTVFVTLKDGRGNRIASPSRSIAQVALAEGARSFAATVTSGNPVAIVVAHGIEVPPGTSDTLLMRADIAAGAPAGEIRLEIERSRDVAMSVTVSGGGAGPAV